MGKATTSDMDLLWSEIEVAVSLDSDGKKGITIDSEMNRFSFARYTDLLLEVIPLTCR